jgi:tRNA threonylcarbamoyladenosine biosynthesis protein TsaB
MRILAFDTTSEHGSLALCEAGRLVAVQAMASPDGYGHVLFQAIEALLARHDWTLASLAGIAAAAGPGSFTGVRVGLSAAKGLAETLGVPCAAVSNLAAMASFGTADVRAPFFDARRGEVYGALYDAALTPMRPASAGKLAAFLAQAPAAAELLTPDPAPYTEALAGRRLTITPRELAGAVALLAPAHWQDPVAIDANYVRRSDAELNWKDS